MRSDKSVMVCPVCQCLIVDLHLIAMVRCYALQFEGKGCTVVTSPRYKGSSCSPHDSHCLKISCA